MVIVLCFFVFFFVWFIIAEGCVNWTCAVARVSACASTCADDGVTSEQCPSLPFLIPVPRGHCRLVCSSELRRSLVHWSTYVCVCGICAYVRTYTELAIAVFHLTYKIRTKTVQ